jgi:hypothetical protein
LRPPAEVPSGRSKIARRFIHPPQWQWAVGRRWPGACRCDGGRGAGFRSEEGRKTTRENRMTTCEGGRASCPRSFPMLDSAPSEPASET